MSHYLVMLLLLHSVTPIHLYKDCFPPVDQKLTPKAELQVYSTTLKFLVLEEAIEQRGGGGVSSRRGVMVFIENQKIGVRRGL